MRQWGQVKEAACTSHLSCSRWRILNFSNTWQIHHLPVARVGQMWGNGAWPDLSRVTSNKTKKGETEKSRRQQQLTKIFVESDCLKSKQQKIFMCLSMCVCVCVRRCNLYIPGHNAGICVCVCVAWASARTQGEFAGVGNKIEKFPKLMKRKWPQIDVAMRTDRRTDRHRTI